jgi:DNA-binding phage protein
MAKKARKRKTPRKKRVSKSNPRRGRKLQSIARERRVGISDARLERALRVYSRTKNLKAAARSIRVSEERLKRAALRKVAIRKKRHTLAIVRRLPRKMPVFTNGKIVAATVKSRSASLIGRYMSAVAQFLKTNDSKFLTEFRGRSVRDMSGKIHEFETNPNVLYRLSSAGNEPFEDIYRIVI